MYSTPARAKASDGFSPLRVTVCTDWRVELVFNLQYVGIELTILTIPTLTPILAKGCRRHFDGHIHASQILQASYSWYSALLALCWCSLNRSYATKSHRVDTNTVTRFQTWDRFLIFNEKNDNAGERQINKVAPRLNGGSFGSSQNKILK